MEMSLSNLYPAQGQAVLGRRKMRTTPVVEQLEAEKPAYRETVQSLVSQWAADAQSKKRTDLMEQQLAAQKSAATDANRIKTAQLGLEGLKLGWDLYNSDFFSSLASLFK